MANAFTLDVLPDLRYLFEEIYRENRLCSFRGGESIPMKPEEIWVVCQGVVQLSTSSFSGDEALLGFASPSMPFGYPLSSLDPYYAKGLCKVDLLRLTLSDIEESAPLAQGLFCHLSHRLRQTEAILALFVDRRVEERLRHLLLILKEEIGQPTQGGTRLTVKLTHQQLANTIGTNRVTATRLLGKLRDEQWLKLDQNRHIVIMA